MSSQRVEKCLYCGAWPLETISHRSDGKNILLCRDCSLMMVDAIEDNPAQLYENQYFEKSERSDSQIGYGDYWRNPAAEVIGKYGFARMFQQKVGRHVDLGAADGSLMEIFRSAGFDTKGLEISETATTIARSKGLDVRESDMRRKPLQVGRVDLVTAFDFLEHTAHPSEALKNALSLLSDGGYFVFSTVSVKSTRPTEYWFNHSHEHYLYYTEQGLKQQLGDTFGEGNFLFYEVTVHGASEFWGIAKKGKLSKRDRHLFDQLTSEGSDLSEQESYWAALFANQTAQIGYAMRLLREYGQLWSSSHRAQAWYYYYYFQGKLERALAEVDQKGLSVEANSVYWQSAFRAKERLTELQKQALSSESAEEIIGLRTQLFKAKDEINALRNSRVVGRLIKSRDYIMGRLLPAAYHLPGRVLKSVKEALARHLPESIRRPVMKVLRFRIKHLRKKIKVVKVKRWGQGPLVSVVVPYYNRADTIDDTLYSLDQQTLRDFEIIIVDDGSTDEMSSRKLRSIEKAGYSATFVYQDNQGVAAARNNGIKVARGKYIVCLDSDDMIEPTYLEKMATLLEAQPDIAIATSHMSVFGVLAENFEHADYDPLLLYKNNTVITAAMFRKEAWLSGSGYKAGIGYEDWEFWIDLAERGYWGKLVPERLFKYRTSMQSRYVDDKEIHWNNLKVIRSLHPRYKAEIKKLLRRRELLVHRVLPQGSMVNLLVPTSSDVQDRDRVLITIPWMTFGGAETLIYNFCREIMSDYSITFVTGLRSENEWQYKFEEVSKDIFHLANLFEDPALYLEYLSRLIRVRGIHTLHIIHNGFTFDMLEELKRRHPHLRVIVTLFNDRTPYFQQALKAAMHVDVFTSDTEAIARRFEKEKLNPETLVRLIPNGINCVSEFNPALYSRDLIREELGLSKNELAVFFVGRLSEEKNPDIFLEVAARVARRPGGSGIKFYVIGDGVMRKQVEDSIERTGSKNITYLGYQERVARFLAASDVLVLPSQIEGFPLSILEAMAMQVVVIASDVGAVSQVLDHERDGFVLPVGAIDDIVKTIMRLDKDRDMLAEMKGLSREKVERLYSNPVLGRNYRDLYAGK